MKPQSVLGMGTNFTPERRARVSICPCELTRSSEFTTSKNKPQNATVPPPIIEVEQRRKLLPDARTDALRERNYG